MYYYNNFKTLYTTCSYILCICMPVTFLNNFKKIQKFSNIVLKKLKQYYFKLKI